MFIFKGTTDTSAEERDDITAFSSHEGERSCATHDNKFQLNSPAMIRDELVSHCVIAVL